MANLKYLAGQLQSDLNVRTTYKESYWAMLSYRHAWQDLPGQPNSLLVYAGLNYKNFSFGYAYDLGLNSMQRYGYGSHVPLTFSPPKKIYPLSAGE